MQSSNGKPNTDKKNISKYIDKNMSHISQITSIILSGLLQLYTHRPAQKSINAMQCIQNIRANMIMNKKPRDSATECLKELPWLQIQQRIDFKISVLVFKSLNKQTPKYLQELIIMKEQKTEGLRSSTKHNLLDVPTTRRKTFASRVFGTYGPTKWNKLPDSSTCSSLDTFTNY